LAGDSDEEIASPLYATAVGLVMDGLKRQERKRIEKAAEKETVEDVEIAAAPIEEEEVLIPPIKKERRSFLDKLTDRVKDFLDNAE
jgi:cell division protein FtsA